MSGPTPTPTPGVTQSPTSGSHPTPQATPSPEPNFPPIPPLPDVPPNAYQLLLTLSDTIDTTAGSFKTSAGKLGDIHKTTNTAVGDVVANSKGRPTTALNDIWGYTKKDFTNAQTPLTSITGSTALGGSTNQLQQVLDQHKADFINGIPAVDKLRNFMSSHSNSNLTPDAVQALVDTANGLTSALGNVNMVLQTMLLAIDNINGGISMSCQTGLVPGQPIPTFNQHAFAMEGKGGSGGSGKDISADDLQQHLEDQGVDPETALNIALYAEEQGVSLSSMQKMFDSLVSNGSDAETAAEQMQQLVDSGSLSRLDGTPGRDVGDVTNLLNNNFSMDSVTSLLNKGADLKSALTSSQDLLNKGASISDINQWAQKGMDLKYAKTLMNRGVSADKINSYINDYTSTDPGSKKWTTLPKNTKSDIAAALQRWSNRSSTGIGNDGTTFQNRPQTVVRNGRPVQAYPFPGNKTGPYTEYNVGTTGNRIVVDSNGQAYYYPSEQGHYHPNDAVPIPYSFISKILGG